MSGVVLRCPTCGTTQVKPGECEACSDGTVRYFCDNHTPGLWLDAPACKVCGATVGKPAPKTSERSIPAGDTIQLHRTRRSGVAPTETPGRREPISARSRRPLPREVDFDETAAAPSLTDLLARLSTDRERPTFEVDERPSPAPELPERAPVLRGCLFRLLLLILVFVALVVAGFVTLLGGIFQ